MTQVFFLLFKEKKKFFFFGFAAVQGLGGAHEDSYAHSISRLVAAFGVGGLGLMGLAEVSRAEDEADHGLHSPAMPWSHGGFLSSYDHAS